MEQLTTQDTGISQAAALTGVGSLLGLAFGLYYANKQDSGFWGYVGYILLFNTIGWALGASAGLTIKAFKQ